MPVSNKPAAPYWSAPGATLYQGDVRAVLRAMPARSVHTCVTSPPYWNLRDYGTGTWEGGSVECDHVEKVGSTSPTFHLLGNPSSREARDKADASRTLQYRKNCKKCGAMRTDMQLGAEPSPDCGTLGKAQCGACFVCSMVSVFSELKRVLRDDGTCWLNLGDTFENGQLLIPSRVALALVADGWFLAQRIVWHSPDKMPESVTKRCTKSYEDIFLLAKSADYYFDHVAIQEEASDITKARDKRGKSSSHKTFNGVPGQSQHRGRTHAEQTNDKDRVVPSTANKRDVWIVPKSSYPGAHFATFNPKLITPCILAGTSEHGCCAQCGAPYSRVVAKVGEETTRPFGGLVKGAAPGQSMQSSQRKDRDRSFDTSRNGLSESGSTLDGVIAVKQTVGWQKTCGCGTREVVPATVLDPFVGSGTTVATALQLGRHGVGIDLSEEYLRNDSIPRIEAAMRGEKVARRPTAVMQPVAPPSPKVVR